MRVPRRVGFRDPATYYALLGVALIAASLWLPWATAARTARVEMRADRIAALLAEAGRSLPPDAGPADVDHVWARLQALAAADGVFFADVERIEPPLPGTLIAFTNKHYAFHLARSPLPGPEPVAVDVDELALEALAWPRDEIGPGHAVYFHPDDAPRAYTRNLTGGVAGLGDKRPEPGSAHRVRTLFETPWSYRSAADERWILY